MYYRSNGRLLFSPYYANENSHDPVTLHSKLVPIIFFFLLTSCATERFEVDVDDIELEMPLRRLDVEIFHLDPGSVSSFHQQKLGAEDHFYEEYIENILKAGPMNDSLTPIRLQRFVLDPNWNIAQASVEEEFGEMQLEQVELENAFKRYTSFFPGEIAPEIFIFNSGFNYAIYPMDSTIGIGIEWFLGDSNEIVQRLAPDAFPEYVKRRMRPEYLITSTMTGWLFVHRYRDLNGADLITNMVHHGKVLFALDKILPDTPDSLKIGYTQAQLDWCSESEFNIWAELAVNDVLFTKKPREIGRLMNDGPFTNGFPRGSPGRVGEWVGWQMVNAYMAEHEDKTIEDLFNNVEASEVMKSYRPGKN